MECWHQPHNRSVETKPHKLILSRVDNGIQDFHLPAPRSIAINQSLGNICQFIFSNHFLFFTSFLIVFKILWILGIFLLFPIGSQKLFFSFSRKFLPNIRSLPYSIVFPCCYHKLFSVQTSVVMLHYVLFLRSVASNTSSIRMKVVMTSTIGSFLCSFTLQYEIDPNGF